MDKEKFESTREQIRVSLAYMVESIRHFPEENWKMLANMVQKERASTKVEEYQDVLKFFISFLHHANRTAKWEDIKDRLNGDNIIAFKPKEKK